MDSLHPQMMQGINTGHTDDEMMDSEFDNQIQPDDDYDIDLDVADAFSNNADEEMKEDVPATYDNDDVMVDEVEFHTQATQLVPETQLPHEEMIFSQMHPSHPTEGPGYAQFSITEAVQATETTASTTQTIESIKHAVEPTASRIDAEGNAEANTTIEITRDVKDVPTVTVTDVQPVEENGTETEQQTEPVHSHKEQEATTTIRGEEEGKTGEDGDGVSMPSSHGEAQPERSNNGSSVERRDSNASNAETPKIHPVIVQFGSEVLAFFNAQYYINHNDTHDDPNNTVTNEFPAPFLINDFSLYNKGFDEVFAVLRELLGPSIGDDVELTMEFDGLELFLHEDNAMSKNITPCELVDLYVRLSLQDGVENPEPLYIALATQPRFTKRYSELLSAAGEGKGLSQVASYTTPAEEYRDDDDGKQHNEQQHETTETDEYLEEKDTNVSGQESGKNAGDSNNQAQVKLQGHVAEQVGHVNDEEEDIPDLTEEEQQQSDMTEETVLNNAGAAKVAHALESNNPTSGVVGHNVPVEEDDDELLPEEDQDETQEYTITKESQVTDTAQSNIAITREASALENADNNSKQSPHSDLNQHKETSQLNEDNKNDFNAIEFQDQGQVQLEEDSIDTVADELTDIEEVGDNELLGYDPSELQPEAEGKSEEQGADDGEETSPREEDYGEDGVDMSGGQDDEEGEYVEDDTFYTVGTSHTVTINSTHSGVDYEDESFTSAVVVAEATPRANESPESGTIIAQSPQASASQNTQSIPSYQGDEEEDAEDDLHSYKDENDEPRTKSQEPEYEEAQAEENNDWDESAFDGATFEGVEVEGQAEGHYEEDAEYEEDDGEYHVEHGEDEEFNNERTEKLISTSKEAPKQEEKDSAKAEEHDDAGSYEEFQNQFEAQEDLNETRSPVNKRERADDEDELYEYETHDIKRTRSD